MKLVEDEKGREGEGEAEPNTGVGKSRFTVLHMEAIQINNTIMNI